MRTYVIAAVLAAALPLPARAAGLVVTITVGADLGACATVESPVRVDAVGLFAAGGYAAGPGTIVAPAGGATTIVMTGETTWRGCVNGAYAGATRGEAHYVVAVTTGNSDNVTARSCVESGGMVSCS